MKRIYSVLVENRSGVLSRIAGLFSRRGFNIESLAVGVTESDDLSRMTIVTDDEGSEPQRIFEQIRKQLSKMIDTVRVKALSPTECILRELVLIKLKGDINSAALLCIKHGARIAEYSEDTVTIEITAEPEKVRSIFKAFDEFEIIETVRTGVISLQKGSSSIK
ncbi:MAG: acetolactate synthase small subunit [Ruminococcus sp.]|jgi:acetolactate synthase-1/3 small subunit|nr:acetolactate synthase small subunit [Ruminococcus sp.]